MPDLFHKLFRSSSKAKRSAPANASPSATAATPLASTSHTSVDPAINLHLVTIPTATDHQIDIQNEQKQRCIDHGIMALKLLKEISEVNDALSALEAICGVTLVILNTIEVDMVSLLLLRLLIEVFRLWIVTRYPGRTCRILFINIEACFSGGSTRQIGIR